MNHLMTPDSPPRVVDMLESAEAELAQFRKELSNDKAKVHDRYEQLKKELRVGIRQMKEMISENKGLGKDMADALKLRLLQLEEQVRLPKASEADVLAQHENIRKAAEEVVKYLGSLSLEDLSLAGLADRIYRYKIKFAILKLRIQLGALKMKDTVLDLRHDIRVNFHRSENRIEKRWGTFFREISEAYDHLQKAFTTK